jgi:hypothetical protein
MERKTSPKETLQQEEQTKQHLQKIIQHKQETRSAPQRRLDPNAIRSTSLRTNKNGLPFETQQALLINVLRYQGLDEFARGTCDSNPALFGDHASKKRKACQDKRRKYLRLYRLKPKKFLELCAKFGAVPVDGENPDKRTLKPDTLHSCCSSDSSASDASSSDASSTDDVSSVNTSNRSGIVPFKGFEDLSIASSKNKSHRTVLKARDTNIRSDIPHCQVLVPPRTTMSHRKASKLLRYGKLFCTLYILIVDEY